MGAGASLPTDGVLSELPEATNADISALANTTLPASSTSNEARQYARVIKDALCTREGWAELSSLFKALRGSLDDVISSEEWSSMVYENVDLCTKYFGNATPEEIAEQFSTLDDECARGLL